MQSASGERGLDFSKALRAGLPVVKKVHTTTATVTADSTKEEKHTLPKGSFPEQGASLNHEEDGDWNQVTQKEKKARDTSSKRKQKGRKRDNERNRERNSKSSTKDSKKESRVSTDKVQPNNAEVTEAKHPELRKVDQ